MLKEFLDETKRKEKELSQKLANLYISLKNDSLKDTDIFEVHSNFSELINYFEKFVIKDENKNLTSDEKDYLEETTQNLLELIICYWKILRDLKSKTNIVIPEPQATSYSTIQKIVNCSKISKEKKMKYISECELVGLPIVGFNKKNILGFFHNKKFWGILLSFVIFICTFILTNNDILRLGAFSFLVFCFIFLYDSKKITGLKYLISRIVIVTTATVIISKFINFDSLKVESFWMAGSGAVGFLLILYYKNPPNSDSLK